MRQHEASHPSLNPPLHPSPPSSLQMPFRVNFPSFFMALIRAPTQAQPYQAVFRVAPAMNKLEIREYLTKIYGLSVRKVMTANLAGRRKRYLLAYVCVYVCVMFRKAVASPFFLFYNVSFRVRVYVGLS